MATLKKSIKAKVSTNLMTIRELGVKYNAGVEIELDKTATLNSSKMMHTAFRKIFNADTIDYRETFHVIFLNNSLKPIAHTKIADGGTDAIMVDVKLIFSQALVTGANHIVLAHNHPSGVETFSGADINLTRKLMEGAKLLDLHILDHLILMPNGNYISYLDEGY